MGKKSKKPAATAGSTDDNALLDAAIAQSRAERRAADEAAAQAQQEEAPAVHPVAREVLGHDVLTHQQVVEKLDAVPAFHIVATDGKMMVPTDDGDAPCVCFYLDPEDARAQLHKLRAANPSLQLALDASPLGTAFALSEGWSPVPEDAMLRLQASRAAIASLPEPPEPLPPALRERFNPRTSALPILMLDGFRTAKGATPAFLDVPTLLATWQRETGLAREHMPSLTVIDLRLVVARMLSQPNEWTALTLVAPHASLELARAMAVESGDEPPPLQ